MLILPSHPSPLSSFLTSSSAVSLLLLSFLSYIQQSPSHLLPSNLISSFFTLPSPSVFHVFCRILYLQVVEKGGREVEEKRKGEKSLETVDSCGSVLNYSSFTLTWRFGSPSLFPLANLESQLLTSLFSSSYMEVMEWKIGKVAHCS